MPDVMTDDTVLFATLDYVLLGLVIFSAFWGAMRGFTRTFLTLISWFTAPIVAEILCGPLTPFFMKVIKVETFARWTAWAGVAVFTFFLSVFLSRKIYLRVYFSSFAKYDALFGAILGVLRGVFFVVVMYFVDAAIAPIIGKDFFDGTFFERYFHHAMTAVEGMLPGQGHKDTPVKPHPTKDTVASAAALLTPENIANMKRAMKYLPKMMGEKQPQPVQDQPLPPYTPQVIAPESSQPLLPQQMSQDMGNAKKLDEELNTLLTDAEAPMPQKALSPVGTGKKSR